MIKLQSLIKFIPLLAEGAFGLIVKLKKDKSNEKFGWLRVLIKNKYVKNSLIALFTIIFAYHIFVEPIEGLSWFDMDFITDLFLEESTS